MARRVWWPAAIAVTVLSTSCSSGHVLARAGQGQLVEVMAAWSGTEQRRFDLVLARFQRGSGYSVRYIAAPDSVPKKLSALLAAGDAPDVALLPQPGLLRQYARSKALVPIDEIVGQEVRRDYSPVWQRLGSVDGQLYGVWFKAANKSLIWYNIGCFERAKVVPPDDLEGLVALAGKLRRSGVAPFALGAAQGWTIADWFDNLFLATQGLRNYDRLALHQQRWTSPPVRRALQWLSRLLQPRNLAGGPQGALRTSFGQAVVATFSEAPRAAMVSEGDFVAGVIGGSTSAQLGVDADVFRFPGLGSVAPSVVGGGDVAVMMKRSPGAEALLRYLATPEAASVWAALGGFISPNLAVDPAVYPDDISRSVALDVVDSGEGFRFGLADLQPAGFGATPGRGLYKELQEFLVDRDVEATAARLEADARAAYGR